MHKTYSGYVLIQVNFEYVISRIWDGFQSLQTNTYPAMDVMEQDQALTTEEARLYDRQIRLWGVNAQRRLGSARVFVHGFTGVMSEVCKNVVLSGIHSLTINDVQECVMRDLAGNLFLDSDSVGRNVCHPCTPLPFILVTIMTDLSYRKFIEHDIITPERGPPYTSIKSQLVFS